MAMWDGSAEPTEEALKAAVTQKISNFGNIFLCAGGFTVGAVMLFMSMYVYAIGILLITFCITLNAINSYWSEKEDVVDVDIIQDVKKLQRSLEYHIQNTNGDTQQKLIEFRPTVEKLYSFADANDERSYAMFDECLVNTIDKINGVINAK